MGVLEGFEPVSVFHYFEEISKIPHISYHEEQLSDYCVAFAKERNLEYYQDEMSNVVIIKEATKGYEDAEPIIIQGHLDMVGDKDPDYDIDMEKESIRLLVEGDYITADRTTLGADDGIAIAFGLALLDSNDIPHPRLEVVFTVSEEVGLEGATGIDLSMCKSHRLINIDSEEEGVITAGCAGGVRTVSRIPVTRQTKEGLLCQLKIRGLLGGHSGIEIQEGRANANILLGRFFLRLKETCQYALVSMAGGVKDNAIAKDAVATFVVAAEAESAVKEAVATFQGYMDTEYAVTDPGIKLILEVQGAKTEEVLDRESTERVITALALMPNGVQTMSADIEGLVETSLNMGVMELNETELVLDYSLRSSLVSAKEMMADKIKQLTKMLGGTTEPHGDYPSWAYQRESVFREKCIRIYEDMYGKTPKVDIIHAGLECGILSGKIEGLECISIGPDMFDVHTPNEKISISSIARVWEYVKKILEQK